MGKIAFILALFVSSTAFAKVDLIFVSKKHRKMALYEHYKLVAAYDVALGSNPVGHKQFEGDGKTPEGTYRIVSKRIHPKFHKSLKISYPNRRDEKFARSQGLSPGGEILIHGLKESFKWAGPLHDWMDWTQGCVAVTNSEMDEIYDLVQVGTTVIISAE